MANERLREAMAERLQDEEKMASMAAVIAQLQKNGEGFMQKIGSIV